MTVHVQSHDKGRMTEQGLHDLWAAGHPTHARRPRIIRFDVQTAKRLFPRSMRAMAFAGNWSLSTHQGRGPATPLGLPLGSDWSRRPDLDPVVKALAPKSGV